MGVTIHLKGKLKSNKEYEKVIKIATDFALLNNMPFHLFEENNKKLLRVKNGVDWDYEGPTRGVKIEPAINCEPLWLEFDKDNIIQEYCKTQFVNKEIHIKIITLLRQLKPSFNELIVDDEGEYWETDNSELLQTHLDKCFIVMEKLKDENPNMSGPYIVEGDRIIDLM